MSFNYDVVGKTLTDLRDDASVAALVSGRVRGFEPAVGDAKGPGHYQAFVVLIVLDMPREKRIPLQRPLIGVRCYGSTPQNAMEVFTACSNALHYAGPRMAGSGLGIWNSFDNTGGSATKDPDTGQPYVEFIAEIVATTVAVA